MLQHNFNYPHRRKNILTGDWILVSPHRTDRPWQGEISGAEDQSRPEYDPKCYLCPGNKRANGAVNPHYKNTFVFTNDFPALLENKGNYSLNKNDILIAKSENGVCKVINYSPRHDLTIAEMEEKSIEKVIETWRSEFKLLGSNKEIKNVQIFENKGVMMGNSNPHPHCQIWAQKSMPTEITKELRQFRKYFKKHNRSILQDYLKLELKLNERIVYQNESFVILVPYWAVWPFETLIIPKRKIGSILQFKEKEVKDFANALKTITTKYDNLFQTSFPYSCGMHQPPTDGKVYKEWHFHMHYYPPLLRSAKIKKFMVGYEMLAEPQRDITSEYSADVLKKLSVVHYKK